MLVKLFKLPKTHSKKYKIVFSGPNPKTLYFGDSAYQDFTQHGNRRRKLLYLARHEKNEDWSDPYTAGFWSRWLLWNRMSVNASIKDIRAKFGIVVYRYER
jgi:hypothetical protein